MPVFHTRTIEKILAPVADQVSQLIILHEAGEGGAAIPILVKPVGAVKSAVTTLSTVGLEQIKKTNDEVLKMDTPFAIEKLEASADLLVDASASLSVDEYSKTGREKLISGARGILQGTSDLLLVFDEAEVRRMCQVCQSVRDYLKISNAVQLMEDLITYVKNLTFGMTNMSKLVIKRSKDLTNSFHAEKLMVEIGNLKISLPSLISSMKTHISIIQEQDLSNGQAVARKSCEFDVKHLSNVITEIIRLLQLVSTDQETVLDEKDVLQFHEVQNNITRNVEKAHLWINDPKVEIGSPSSLALYKALGDTRTIGIEIGGGTGDRIVHQCDDVAKMADSLKELTNLSSSETVNVKQLQQQMHQALDHLLQDGDSALQQIDVVNEAQNTIASNTLLAKEWLFDSSAMPGCGSGSATVKDITDAAKKIAVVLSKDSHKIKHAEDLLKLCDEIDKLMEEVKDYRIKNHGNLPEARHLSKQVSDKVVVLNNKIATVLAKNATPSSLEDLSEVVNSWLKDTGSNDNGQGIMAVRNVVFDACVLAADVKNTEIQKMLLQKSIECEKLCNYLDDLKRGGLGDSAEACKIVKELQTRFDETKDIIRDVLVEAIADEFSDTTTILQQFVHATAKPVSNGAKNFKDEALVLNKQTQKLAKLGYQAAAINSFDAKGKSKAVKVGAKKVTDLTQQVINAGKVVLEFPENKQAQKHFRALQNEWTKNMGNFTEQVDDCMDAARFFKVSEEGICHEHEKCTMAMENHCPQLVLPAAGNIVRRAHRMLMIGRHEVENTDEDQYTYELSTNIDAVSNIIHPMVQATREYAHDPSSKLAQDCLKGTNKNLIKAISQVRKTLEAKLIKEQQTLLNLQMKENAPPRPPLPMVVVPPPLPPLPEEVPFPEEDNHEMMQAARGLHEQATKWTSKGNDIISSAKKMALLMAKMSCLVRSEDGKKCDLIACAQEIAKASGEVARFSTEVAEKCTDKRIRNDMKKTLDRIPTISTQLRILSTVKAASLGDKTKMTTDETKAAEQATEMLVHNAQNLMMSVKDTVRYSEAASIRIRTDTGLGGTMRWIRK